MGSVGISNNLDKAIKGYTAKGGQMASKYPFTSEMNKQLLEATSNNIITLQHDIYRKIDLSESEYNKVFNELYETGSWDFNSDKLQSFTEERTRAFSYGGTSQNYILLKIPAGTKVNGMNISTKSIYPEEKEVLLGRNKLVGKYSDIDWTSSNNMIITLRR